MKRMFKKTYLEVDFAENKLKNDGVLREKKFGLRKTMRGKQSVIKNCHISLIKLKTRVFRGLDNREKHH